jgi:hypothetical protein
VNQEPVREEVARHRLGEIEDLVLPVGNDLGHGDEFARCVGSAPVFREDRIEPIALGRDQEADRLREGPQARARDDELMLRRARVLAQPTPAIREHAHALGTRLA